MGLRERRELRQDQETFAQFRNDWRFRMGATLMPDSWIGEGDGELAKFWDMGNPPYRQVEDKNEWIVVWTRTTLEHLETCQTHTDNLAQIVCGPFMIWADDRCLHPSCGVSTNTLASVLIRKFHGARPFICGPVLVTGYPHLEWTPNPPAPLLPGEVVVLRDSSVRARMLLDTVSGQ